MQLASFIIASTLISFPRVEVHFVDNPDARLNRVETYLISDQDKKMIRSIPVRPKDFSTSVNATFNEYLISNFAIAVNYQWKRFATVEVNEVVGVDSQRTKQRLRVLLRTWDYSGRIISDRWVAVPLNNEPAFLGIDDRGAACIVYADNGRHYVASRLSRTTENPSIPSSFDARLKMSIGFGADGGSIDPFQLGTDGYTAQWPDIRLHQLVLPGGKVKDFGGSLESKASFHFDSSSFTGQWGTKRKTFRWKSNPIPAYVYLLSYPYFIGSIQSSVQRQSQDYGNGDFDSLPQRATYIYNIESGTAKELSSAWLTVPLQ